MLLLASVARVLWGFWARVRLVNLKQKSGVFLSPLGFLSKGRVRHTAAGRQERIFISRAVGEVISGT